MSAVDDFQQRLKDSGLLSPDDIRAVLDQAAAALKSDNAKAIASEFVRRGKLTKYQATAVWQGKHDALVMGNYVILDVIGQGGMGTVFKAEHRRLKRVVALKMLSSSAMKVADAVDRFRREAEAVGKLNHRNIVAAHDAGEFRDKHFLVMEYVAGTDLDRLVTQQGPLPVDVAAACILQAARGLEYAHARGVLHRDVKPANLLLTSDGDRAVIKVLDLGLAWVRGSSSNESSGDAAERLTRNDRIMGTVDFMAPEQALEIHSADQRADIYSLGCSWYFLVSGRAMYPADTVLKQLVAHRESPIPSLPDAGEALNAVLRKMVAKQPDERYPSMSEVIAALKACGISDAQASGALDLSDVEAHKDTVVESQPSVSLSANAPLAALPTTKRAKAGGARSRRKSTSSANPYWLIGGGAAALVAVIGLLIWSFTRGGGPRETDAGPPAVVANVNPAPQPGAVSAANASAAAKVSEPTPPVEPESHDTLDVTGEYATTIADEPWAFQVRRNGAKFAVRLFKGGLPGDGWDRQTIYDLAASPQDGRVKLDQNPRVAGEFAPDQLTGTSALGEPFVAQRVVRRSPTLDKTPPAGATVLFDGRNADSWMPGAMTPDGWLMAGAATKALFRDFTLHLEYRLPDDSVPAAKVRSELILQGRYQIAIANSFGDDPSETACAAIDERAAPSLNMCFPRDQWQTFDISFTAPRFDTSGVKTANARCTVRHNGVEVHDKVEWPTAQVGDERPDPGPIVLGTRTDSGIVFRNIWLEETKSEATTAVKRTWPEPNATLQTRMKAVGGMIRDEFALVQTLPFDEFAKIAESFQEAGYRPVRLRPFALPSGALQASALWHRDGHEWRTVTANAVDTQKQAEKLLSEGLWPVDIAGYASKGGELYVTLWARLPENPAVEARVHPGVRHIALKSTFGDFPNRGYAERIDHVFSATRAQVVHSTLWWKSPAKTEGWYGDQAYYEGQNKGFQLDVCITRGPLAGGPAYSWCSLEEAPAGSESIEVHGLSPDAHLKRCAELADEGHFPVAIGVAHVNAPTAVQACSVWHRRKE